MSSNLAIPLLLLIAQTRSRILFCEESTQLKLISHLFDTSHDVLMQFTDFFVGGATRGPDYMARLMPSMESLLNDTGLTVPVAFQLVRPIMRAALQKWPNVADLETLLSSIEGESNSHYPKGGKDRHSKDNKGKDKDREKEREKMMVVTLGPWHPFGQRMLNTVKTYLSERQSEARERTRQKEREMLELKLQLQTDTDGDASTGMSMSVTHETETTPVKDEDPDDVDVWSVLSPELYLLFWALSLYDVYVPTEKYESELKRLKDRNKALIMSLPVSRSVPLGMNGQGKGSTVAITAKAREEEQNKLLVAISELTTEMNDLGSHVKATRALVAANRDKYFSHVSSENWLHIVENILQHCVLDRVLMSPLDAVYCAHFARLLHNAEVPLVSTVNFMYKGIISTVPLMFCASNSEAQFIGFYINELLKIIVRWSNPKVYEEEAQSKIGFAEKLEAISDASAVSRIEFIKFGWYRAEVLEIDEVE